MREVNPMTSAHMRFTTRLVRQITIGKCLEAAKNRMQRTTSNSTAKYGAKNKTAQLDAGRRQLKANYGRSAYVKRADLSFSTGGRALRLATRAFPPAWARSLKLSLPCQFAN